MKREEIPHNQQNNVAYLKEEPAYLFVFGLMEIILGFALLGAVIMTMTGISRYGVKDYFQRMKNTAHFFSDDYYDIRTEDFESEDMLVGSGSKKTNADVRSVAACLKLDKSKPCLMPGAFGTTTFFVIPKDADKDIAVEIELNVCGITKADNGEYVRLSETCGDTGRKAEELLDGHILFFTEYNGAYSGLLKDSKMVYNTADHHRELNENGEYKVTVYWVWAEYYEQLVDTAAEGALITDNAVSDEMKRYIEERQDEFFFTDDTQLNDPSRSYNDGDLFIHQNVDYYGFEIKALN